MSVLWLRVYPQRSCCHAAGDLSRNRTVGLRIGKGETLQQIIGGMTAVAEGVLTSRSGAGNIVLHIVDHAKAEVQTL